MKDLYTFDTDVDAARATYETVQGAYRRIFDRVFAWDQHVPAWRAAEADTGAMGGKVSHEYHVEDAAGEDVVMTCDSCSFAANTERAVPRVREHSQNVTIDSFAHRDGAALAIYPKGRVLNEALLPWPATPGSGSVAVIAVDRECDLDEESARRIACECGYDATNSKVLHSDIRTAKSGDGCSACENGTLHEHRAIEVGHAFLLGSRYTQALGYGIAVNGKRVPMQMGCYGIGVTRIMGALAQRASALYKENVGEKGRAGFIAPREVHWSWQDRSAFMRINRDASVVGTDKGFRSARTNVGVRYGACYVEIRILSPDASSSPPVPMRDGPHARVGWGRREASLNAPVGYDAYSYGLRDTSGSRVTLSQLQPFGESFGPGDVVGMYIRLPPPSEPVPSGSEGEINRKHIPIRYKGQLYFESLEYAPTREMEMVMDQSRRGGVREPDEARARRDVPPSKQKKPPRPLPRLTDSCIGFVVNGKPQGIAYTDLYDYRPLRSSKSTRETVVTPHSSAGAILKTRGNPYDDGSLGYFPMVSLYGGARAQLITREFVYPPAADIEDRLWHASEVRQGAPIVRQRAATPWRAIGDLYSEWFANEWSHDLAAERSLRATDST